MSEKPPTDLSALEAAMKAAAQARAAAEEAKAAVSEIEERIAASFPEYGVALGERRERNGVKSKAENEAKAQIIHAFGLTKNKKPVPMAGVRVSTRLLYDPVKVISHCVQTPMLHSLLRLDEGALKQVVKAGLLDDLVVRQEVPSGTLAKDLSIYIPDGIEHAHVWVELTSAQARERKLSHFGACYHVYVCALCGEHTSTDSSG